MHERTVDNADLTGGDTFLHDLRLREVEAPQAKARQTQTDLKKVSATNQDGDQGRSENQEGEQNRSENSTQKIKTQTHTNLLHILASQNSSENEKKTMHIDPTAMDSLQKHGRKSTSRVSPRTVVRKP